MAPKTSKKMKVDAAEETCTARLQVLLRPSIKSALEDIAWCERKSSSELVRELVEERIRKG